MEYYLLRQLVTPLLAITMALNGSLPAVVGCAQESVRCQASTCCCSSGSSDCVRCAEHVALARSCSCSAHRQPPVELAGFRNVDLRTVFARSCLAADWVAAGTSTFVARGRAGADTILYFAPRLQILLCCWLI